MPTRAHRQDPGRHRGVRGIGRSGQSSPATSRTGSRLCEREINIVHDAAIKAGIRLCGPYAWRDRPDFTCFQAGREPGAIARGVKDELGKDWRTPKRCGARSRTVGGKKPPGRRKK